MPSLVAFGRRWNISSDDFVFPGLTEAFVRLVWVVLAIVIFLLHFCYEPFMCESLQWIVYIIVLIAINLISAGFCFSITVFSAKGSISEISARKRVVTLLYIRVPLFIVEVLWAITSTVLVFDGVKSQLCFSLQGIQIAIVLEWILIFAVLLGIFIIFNPHGHSMEDSIMLERMSWRQKFNLCKICQDNEMRNALDDIALLMASFFADNDFVASDIVAGLLLLVHSPHNRIQLSLQTNQLSKNNLANWMILPNCLPTACRMFDIAVAIYGWPTYLFNNFGCISCFKLCKNSKCKRSKQSLFVDNCCAWHTSAFLLESECKETDLFLVSFRNRLFQVPFIVLSDNQTKSIVVAIRGSASLTDLVTDLSLNDEVFSVDVDRDPVLCKDKSLDLEGEVRVHRGMLKAARYVYDKLKKHKTLETAIDRNPTYDLVICGHSLGGGIASLLTLLLKQSYPAVKCFAFSPPGCVISEHGIAETEQHVLSIFVGDDVIPRISIQSLQTLKGNINSKIFSTNKSKYEILIKGIFKLFFSASWELNDNDDDNESDRRWLIENRNTYGARSSTLESDLELAESSTVNSSNSLLSANRVQLYPPGHLLCMQFDDNENVRMNWVNVDYLSEIQLTSSMFTDHWPKKVRKILRQARTENSIII